MAFDPKDLLPVANDKNIGFDPKLLVPGTQQIMEETFRANFDKEHFASPKMRLSLSRGDNLQEKRLRIKKKFPEGDVRVVGKSLMDGLKKDALLFRESPQAQWKMVDPPGIDFTDVGELFAPSAESIALESAIAIGTGGGSIPATVGRQALGAFAGEAFEQATQSATGVQAQSVGQILLEPTIEGGFSALGGFAVSPLVAAGNILGGRGALQVGEEGLDVIQAATRIDPGLSKKLTPGLVTDNPALQLQERQSAALLPGLQRRYRDLVHTLDAAVKGRVNQSAFGKLTQRVSDAFDNLSDTFLQRISRTNLASSKGGKALQQGVKEYDLASRKIVDDLYATARKVEEPQFSLDGLQGISKNLRAGSKGLIDPETEKLLKAVDAIQGPKRLPDGSILSVGEQLRNVRTGAWAAKHVKPGEVANQATGQANDLFRAVNATLDAPLNVDPAFKVAWKNAAKAARKRLETLDKSAIIKVAKTENPAELVGQFAKPGQVDNLLTIRSAVDAKRWNQFVDSFVSDVFSDPTKATAKLGAFDKETLDALLPRAEQTSLKGIAKELGRITDVGVEETIERQIRNKNFIEDIVTNANPQRTRTIMRAANETNNKAMRESIRAGVFDWTWDGIVKQGKKLEINQPLLSRRIEELKRSDMWAFLPKSDRQLLGDAEIVSRSFRRVIDAGTSIQAAEAAKGIGRLEKGAIKSFVQAGIISHFYLSASGRKILIGSGMPNSRGPALRLLGGALTQISRTEDISELEED